MNVEIHQWGQLPKEYHVFIKMVAMIMYHRRVFSQDFKSTVI